MIERPLEADGRLSALRQAFWLEVHAAARAGLLGQRQMVWLNRLGGTLAGDWQARLTKLRRYLAWADF